MSFHPHDHDHPPHSASAQDAARSPATAGEPSQGIGRTGASESSFSALGEVVSSTVGVAPKHLPPVGVGERSDVAHDHASPSGGHFGGADVAHDDPETASGAPHDAPRPPRPIPCEAFDFNMDILREIAAEQRAVQSRPPPDTPAIAPPASATLPDLISATGKDQPLHTNTQPGSALSITSAASGVPGSSPAVDAQVEAWSAGVADDASAPSDARSDLPPPQEPASPLPKGVVEPIHGGFYLAESPSPATTSFPAGELPRLSHSAEGNYVKASPSADGDSGTTRVSLATRLRGEAKVIAGKIKNDDAKVAEGRSLKSGETL